MAEGNGGKKSPSMDDFIEVCDKIQNMRSSVPSSVGQETNTTLFYVLERKYSETELRTIFYKYARVSRISIPRDKETGEPKRFAFIQFETHEDAKKALAGFFGETKIMDWTTLNWAHERKPRTGASTTTN